MSGAPASLPFVGRTHELRSVDAALAAAEEGTGTTLLVTGDAGIGKTSLVGQAVTRARVRGHEVLVGHCVPIDGPPYHALADALRARCAGLDDHGVHHLLGPAHRDLARVLRGRPAPSTETHLSEEEGRWRVLDAALRLLDHLGGRAPVLLAVEDLHWAHPTTLELVVWLGRQLAERPVTLVVTVRTPLAPDAVALATHLAEWSRVPSTRRLDVPPFTRAELADQLGEVLDEVPRRDLVDAVHRRSQGNPFYAGQLAVADGERLPDDLRDLLVVGLRDLAPHTMAALRACAVVGRPVGLDLLAAVLDRPVPAVVEALRPAVERHLLVGDDRGTTSFRHALLAEAVLSTAVGGELRALHAAVAETLEAGPPDGTDATAAELAHHWERAQDAARSLVASVRAAREAEASYAVATAWRHLERAATLWDRVPTAAADLGTSRMELQVWLADLANRAGANVRALEVLEAVLATDDGTREDRGPLLDQLAILHGTGGDFERAASVARDAVAAQRPDGPSPALAHALGTLANALWRTHPEEALPHAREAVAMAEEVGDAALRARSSTLLGCCLVCVGERDEGRDHLDAARELAIAASVPEEIGRVHMYGSDMLLRCGLAKEATAWAEDGLARVRDCEAAGKWASGLAGHVVAGLFHAGRWEDAGRLIAEVEGDTGGVGWLYLADARLRSFLGEHDRARESLALAASYGSGSDARHPVVATWIAVHDGALDEAVALVAARHDHGIPSHAGLVNELCALGLRAIADLATTGALDPAQARSTADELVAELRDPRSGGVAWAAPWAQTARAEHTRLVGGDGVAAWSRAVVAWERLDGWYHAAIHARVRLAEAMAPTDPDEATETLARAVERAQELGAVPLLELAAAIARSAGLTVRRGQPPTGAEGLTGREVEVLRLVAAGRTNRQIGDELYISHKTVSVHVSNILRKLDVSARTEAAAVAFRRGLMDDEGLAAGT